MWPRGCVLYTGQQKVQKFSTCGGTTRPRRLLELQARKKIINSNVFCAIYHIVQFSSCVYENRDKEVFRPFVQQEGTGGCCNAQAFVRRCVSRRHHPHLSDSLKGSSYLILFEPLSCAFLRQNGSWTVQGRMRHRASTRQQRVQV